MGRTNHLKNWTPNRIDDKYLKDKMKAATGEYPAYNNKCNEEINEAIQ